MQGSLRRPHVDSGTLIRQRGHIPHVNRGFEGCVSPIPTKPKQIPEQHTVVGAYVQCQTKFKASRDSDKMCKAFLVDNTDNYTGNPKSLQDDTPPFPPGASGPGSTLEASTARTRSQRTMVPQVLSEPPTAFCEFPTTAGDPSVDK